MKLAVIQCINGNYSVVAEGIESMQAAKVAFYDRCKMLWNAEDVLSGQVAVFDETLAVFDNCIEHIYHGSQPVED